MYNEKGVEMETAVAWFEIQSFVVLCCVLETVEDTHKVNFLAELFRILRHAGSFFGK